MRREFESLIREYQAAVAAAVKELQQRLGVWSFDYYSQWWKDCEQGGWLDDGECVRYVLRPKGFYLVSRGGQMELVVFFGEEGCHDGFNALTLWFFAKRLPKYADFDERQALEDDLANCLIAGELVRREYAGLELFYFPSA